MIVQQKIERGDTKLLWLPTPRKTKKKNLTERSRSEEDKVQALLHDQQAEVHPILTTDSQKDVEAGRAESQPESYVTPPNGYLKGGS